MNAVTEANTAEIHLEYFGDETNHTLQTRQRRPHSSQLAALWWLCAVQMLLSSSRYKTRKQASCCLQLANGRMFSFLEDASANLLAVREIITASGSGSWREKWLSQRYVYSEKRKASCRLRMQPARLRISIFGPQRLPQSRWHARAQSARLHRRYFTILSMIKTLVLIAFICMIRKTKHISLDTRELYPRIV